MKYKNKITGNIVEVLQFTKENSTEVYNYIQKHVADSYNLTDSGLECNLDCIIFFNPLVQVLKLGEYLVYDKTKKDNTLIPIPEKEFKEYYTAVEE